MLTCNRVALTWSFLLFRFVARLDDDLVFFFFTFQGHGVLSSNCALFFGFFFLFVVYVILDDQDVAAASRATSTTDSPRVIATIADGHSVRRDSGEGQEGLPDAV